MEVVFEVLPSSCASTAAGRCAVASSPPRAMMKVVQERTRVAIVTGVVLGVIGVGVLISSQTGSSTAGPMPNTSTARLVESAVVQTEKQYLVPAGSPHPTVSYVATTAAEAWQFLTSIKWKTGEYTNSGAVGPVMTTLPPPGVTTQPAPINLLNDPEPVALIELSGVPVYVIPINPGGPVCIEACTTAPPRPPTAWEADDVFLVVNLDNGSVSGGEMATPNTGTSFSLSNFGSVASWIGPADFGQLTEPVRAEPVSSPAFNSGSVSSTTAPGGP